MKPTELRVLALVASLVLVSAVKAEMVVDQLLTQYQKAGAISFDATRGEALWMVESDGRSCTSCHGADLTEVGEHQKTKRAIKPMAPSVNSERLSKVSKIEKWFLRNCKWTFDRECTPQEKGDLLVWLRTQ